MIHTTDKEIRSAFHKKKLKKYHCCPNTLVIDELGLAHGKNRIDIAVLNGFVHGYEIKSSKDSLTRLPAQFDEYRRSLEKISIVAAENHIHDLYEYSPEWCGLILATKGPKGGVHFTNIRTAKINPEIDTFSFAHILWRKEAVELLLELGENPKELKGPKNSLYSKISSLISSRDLSKKIKALLIQRGDWRAEKLQFQYDDLPQLASK